MNEQPRDAVPLVVKTGVLTQDEFDTLTLAEQSRCRAPSHELNRPGSAPVGVGGCMTMLTYVLLLATALSTPVAASEVAQEPASRAPAPTTQQLGPFLGLDIAGGFVLLPRQDPEPEYRGWEISGTFRPKRWFGVAASFARTGAEQRTVHHALAGVRLNDSYGGAYYTRFFAHALIGVATAGGRGLSGSSPEVVIGGGIDALRFIRVQFDFMRVDLPELPKNDFRVLFGGVLPLCFRGCRPDNVDGLIVSGHKQRP